MKVSSITVKPRLFSVSINNSYMSVLFGYYGVYRLVKIDDFWLVKNSVIKADRESHQISFYPCFAYITNP